MPSEAGPTPAGALTKAAAHAGLLVASLLLAGCEPPAGERPSVRASPASTLDDIAASVDGDGLVYLRSDLMPLSDAGVVEVEDAARRLDLPLHVLDADELYGWLDEGGRALRTARDSAAAALIAQGATAHFPALLVRREGRPLGHAILGYKTADAYREMVARRLAAEDDVSRVAFTPRSGDAASPPGGQDGQERWRDLEVEGDPGAYFRWVPGTRSIAFEMDGAIHLLDLETGERGDGPGYVDLVPSPDGKVFVTPGPGRSGLEFYDAATVLRAAGSGRGADVEPADTDPDMRDQYPSVGLLRSEETGRGTVAFYRVLTSWFDRAAFRDYRVTVAGDGRGSLEVRALGEPVIACRGRRISLPILSPAGDELAARDESTGTTKLFALDAAGGCAETLDLGVPSGKVAFGGNARRLAFSVPLDGVFVLERDAGRTVRVPGSEGVRRLAIPELAGPAGVVFLLAGEGRDEPSRFRIVPRY